MAFPSAFRGTSRACHSGRSGICLDAAEAFRTGDDLLISACLALRDLPGRVIGAMKGMSAHRFSMASFTPLGRHGDRYVLYGFAGAFWRLDYGLHDIGPSSQDFWQESDSGCRLILTFEAEALAGGRTWLVTRAVVSCGTISTLIQMRRYLNIIRPVSGLIGGIILSHIHEKAKKDRK